MTRLLLIFGVVLAVLGGLGLARAGAGNVAPPARLVPAEFTARVNNSWFPLKPGTVMVYRGVKDGKPSRDVVTVTARTKTIQGVPCVVVDDRLYLAGRLRERTSDWYSQDKRGNVWYFGEATAELDVRGRVTTTEGSWQAGRDGASAGILMPAHPSVGQVGRQEFYKGQAEDHFAVVSMHAAVRVPYTSSGSALLTKEWTPLEPGVLDHKFYVRGVGLAREQTVKGGDERNDLVRVRR